MQCVVGNEAIGSAWEAAVLSGLSDGVIVIDHEANVLWANRTAEIMFGEQLGQWVGRCGLDRVHPSDLQMVLISLGTMEAHEVGVPLEVRMRTSRGWRLMEVVGTNHFEDEIGGLVLDIRDVTDRRHWELAHDDDDLFRAVLDNSPSVIGLLEPGGRVRAMSGAITRLLGRDVVDVVGRNLAEIVVPDDRPALASALTAALDGSGARTTVELGLISLLSRDPVPFELSMVGLADDPTVRGVIVSGHDITALREVREALAELASRDPLTGLPNRSTLTGFLDSLLASRDVPGYEHQRYGLAFIDLDGFKRVNDTHGHLVGDAVLREVGVRLRSVVRDGDLVARYGGDEFVIAVRLGRGSAERAMAGLANRLRTALEEPFYVDGGSMPIRAAVGTTLLRRGESPEEAIARADHLMYQAKTSVGSLARS